MVRVEAGATTVAPELITRLVDVALVANDILAVLAKVRFPSDGVARIVFPVVDAVKANAPLFEIVAEEEAVRLPAIVVVALLVYVAPLATWSEPSVAEALALPFMDTLVLLAVNVFPVLMYSLLPVFTTRPVVLVVALN